MAANAAAINGGGGAGRDLTEAIESLPQILSRKANLEAHTNILQVYFYVCLCIYLYLCLYVCMFVSPYVCMYVCIRPCVCAMFWGDSDFVVAVGWSVAVRLS